MAKNWIPRLAQGCAAWLRAPQPRSCVPHDGDLDWRREHADLDAVRNRFAEPRSGRSSSGSFLARIVALLAGLVLYGFSMALMVQAGLGLDPWDVFHQGLARHTGWTIGTACAVAGVVVLLAWIPLRNKPGVGTIANVIVISVAVDAFLAVLPAPTVLWVRVAMMLGAVLLNAIATVLYIAAGLGPGPRDGLMTGLVARTGLSVRLVRTTIEASVVATGWLLGGSVGVGTVIYALGIGPLVQLVLRLTPRRALAASGWAHTLRIEEAPAVATTQPATC